MSRILDFNNLPGEELSGDLEGVPFSCTAWTQENGPGTLVLSATNLDTQITAGMAGDIVAQFVFAD
jgi:hypothetical protein